MASDNHAHYARIGFTVIIGIAAIVATLIYLGGVRGHADEMMIETYYDNAVNGLAVGSPVNARGVKVGEVREISFVSSVYDKKGAGVDDVQRIRIVMAVNKRMLGFGPDDSKEDIYAVLRERVDMGLRASVLMNGITGLSRIEFGIEENPPPCAKLGWKSIYPLVPPSPSLLENFSVAATKLMNRLKTMDISGVWSNLQMTAQSAASIARNTDAMVQSQRTRVNHLIRNADEMSLSLKELSEKLKDNPSLLLRPNDPERLEETK